MSIYNPSLNTIRSKTLEKNCAAIVVLCTFLSQYTFFVKGITIADILLLICSFLMLLNHKEYYCLKNDISKSFVLLYTSGVLISLLQSVSNSQFILISSSKVYTRWIHYGLYSFYLISIFYVCIRNKYLRDYILLTYKFLVILCSLYTITQFIVFHASGYMLPINILPFDWSRDTSTESIVEYTINNYYRGFGPFMEPGYLSKFILPGLLFSIYGWSTEKMSKVDLRNFIIIFLALCFSTSIQGIMIGIVSSAMLLLLSKRNNRLTLFVLTLIAFIILFTIFKFDIDFLRVPKERISAIFNREDYGYSSNMRLYRGFSIWWQLDLISKIFGVGMGNIANYVYNNNIFTPFDHPLRDANYLDYTSALSGILVSQGMIGLFIYLLILLKIYSYSSLLGKILLLQFFLVLFSGSGVYSVESVFYFVILSTTIAYDDIEQLFPLQQMSKQSQS